MRFPLVASILLIAVVAFNSIPATEAQGWEALAAAVATKLVGLWKNDELDFLGHRCNYSVRPKVRKFQLYFRGRMWCPGWTDIRGESMTRSRSGVVGKTTQDFARKAFENGLITEQQARDWLDS